MPDAPTLVPLCTVDLELARPVVIGDGPAGQRMVVDVTAMTFSGDRLQATLVGRSSADWLTVAGGVATIDVRATIVTHDGAHILVQYRGRSDASGGVGTAPMFVAPTFETGDERYAWLNCVQAIGRGSVVDMRYEWFELR